MKLVFLSALILSSLVHAQDLSTVSEKSGFKITGRSSETERLCHDFAKKYPKRISCGLYGMTPQGRRLMYLVLNQDSRGPVVWLQAGIHAGEIDGKDAVFKLFKDILEKKFKNDPSEGLKVVFVPIVNLDGHERFGKWNRPNQVGPEEMGWRTTSQNYNLNRDFAKADAPEMQDLLKLWHRFDPVISLDLHVTNGAQFVPEVGIIVTPNESHGKSEFHTAGSEYEKLMMNKMKEKGRKALPFYPSFEEDDKPSSGFGRYVSPPRFANGYWYVNQRIGVLVESHSWKDYPTRVKVHYDTVLSTLEIMQTHGKKWENVVKTFDQRIPIGEMVNLDFKHSDKNEMIDFEGYEYKIFKSEISGSNVISYDPTKPQIWRVPFFEELVPSIVSKVPSKGYYVPVQEAHWLKKALALHGIKFEVIKKSLAQDFEVFRATQTEFSQASFEGHQTLTVKGEWRKEEDRVEKGSLFIPINQKKFFVLMHLLEPLARDSYLSWGKFNRYFETKEYMENYVAEEVAKEMLKDPKIKAEFENALKNPEFAKDPSRRFGYFYEKHPSWDKNLKKYPVFRL